MNQEQLLTEIRQRVEKADCEAWRTFTPMSADPKPKRHILLFEEDADFAVSAHKDIKTLLSIIQEQRKALESARYVLLTYNNCTCTDSPDLASIPENVRWVINNTADIKNIEKALNFTGKEA